MKKNLFIVLIFIGLMLPETMEAQCAMCRAALESSGDIKAAEGINNGIVYLMALPYILVGGLFYFVYKKMKNRSPEEV
ncbi:hypothetical protein ZORO111903_11040 [Zobellia roscoffensis]